MPFPNIENRLIFKDLFKYSFDYNVLFTKIIDVSTTALQLLMRRN